MADDWQPGDLALCVKRGQWTVCGAIGRGPAHGSICTVRRVGVNNIGRPLIWLVGWPGDHANDGFWADRFRKIHPLTPEEYEETMTELLTGQPIREPV